MPWTVLAFQLEPKRNTTQYNSEGIWTQVLVDLVLKFIISKIKKALAWNYTHTYDIHVSCCSIELQPSPETNAGYMHNVWIYRLKGYISWKSISLYMFILVCISKRADEVFFWWYWYAMSFWSLNMQDFSLIETLLLIHSSNRIQYTIRDMD